MNEQSILIKAVALEEIIWGEIVDREEGSGTLIAIQRLSKIANISKVS